jgi:hypothetical protein
MANPPTYTPSYDFSDLSAHQPNAQQPGDRLDIEFENISDTVDGVVTALADVRRSDGALKNGIVTQDALAAGLLDTIEADLAAAINADAALAAVSATNAHTSEVNAASSATTASSAATSATNSEASSTSSAIAAAASETAAASSATAAGASQTAAAASQSAAATSASNASTSASGAATSASGASTSASSASTSAAAASTSASGAATSASGASTSATAAASSATAAAGSATAAAGSATAAAGSASSAAADAATVAASLADYQPLAGHSVVTVSAAGTAAVAAGTTLVVLNLASPGTVTLTLPTVASQNGVSIKISDWTGNATTLNATPNGSEKIMNASGTVLLGGSSAAGIGNAFSAELTPITALSGWIV